MKEEKEKTAEAVKLDEVIGYISEREENLSRASKKLYEHIGRIESVFGNPMLCQICNTSRSNCAHFKYFTRRYHVGFSEKPQMSNGYKAELVSSNFDSERWGDPKKKVVYAEEHKYHLFVPKIEVSIEIGDFPAFYRDEHRGMERAYYLHIGKNGLTVIRCTEEAEESIDLTSIPLDAMKALVRGERLITFLQSLANNREKAEEELQKITEVADQLANTLCSRSPERPTHMTWREHLKK